MQKRYAHEVLFLSRSNSQIVFIFSSTHAYIKNMFYWFVYVSCPWGSREKTVWTKQFKEFCPTWLCNKQLLWVIIEYVNSLTQTSVVKYSHPSGYTWYLNRAMIARLYWMGNSFLQDDRFLPKSNSFFWFPFKYLKNCKTHAKIKKTTLLTHPNAVHYACCWKSLRIVS